jgi:hypothetical protein
MIDAVRIGKIRMIAHQFAQIGQLRDEAAIGEILFDHDDDMIRNPDRRLAPRHEWAYGEDRDR